MTTQQHYKVFKLKNGDIMAACSDTDITMRQVVENLAIKLRNPVLFASFKFLDSEGELVETISMQPLLPISDDDLYEVRTDHIFSVAKMRDTAAERYQQFLEHLDKVKAEEEAADRKEIAEMQEQLEDDETDATVIDLSKYTTKILH